MSWREIQKQNFIKWEVLADFLQLDEEQRQQLVKKSPFPLYLPLRLAQKMRKGTLDDPLFKQFVPLQSKTLSPVDYTTDPVGDKASCLSSKLLHKYQGRALLICTSACAMHCRYCFRQHFPYEKQKSGYEAEIKLLQEDPSIHEIILSGGDPLSLSNDVLTVLFRQLEEIPHLKRLRFHSRFPIGIPERIDEGFLALLQSSRFQIWFVVHSNHPEELDKEVLQALKSIQRLGIPVLNQAVLLRDVNDDVATLKKLMEKLVDNGISPYYLHQLDKVEGAASFEVDQAHGKWLLQELSKQLPGYAIPSYVKEQAGHPSKTPL